ncbi:hypothetical protein [Ralstonia sp. UBA689]|uniref:hypothetical protein n=1 Tax=Ralstonia sp. UBA689 TaxID=1947373 RepID=UPI0025ECA013|nr:hypothetical protein [Ralstonia sp. UBA689]
MRLPASITAQPPDPADAPHMLAAHVDPAEVSDVQPTPAERKPWWARVSSAIARGAFTNVVAALIAVTGAIYVGMVHAPWVRSLAGYTPTAEQAGHAMSMAVAASRAGAAMSQPVDSAQAAQPDPVAVARDRMEQRVYGQVPQGATRAVAQTEAVDDGAPVLESGSPAASGARRHHRRARHAYQGGSAWNAHWYKGA